MVDPSSSGLRHAVSAATGLGAVEEIVTRSEPAQILGQLLGRAVALTGADAGTLSRVEDGHLILKHSTESDLEAGSTWMLLPQIEEAIEAGRPIQLHHTEFLPNSLGFRPGARGARRALILPLMVAGDSVGVMVLIRKREEPFGWEEIEAGCQLGLLTALAVNQVHLVQRDRDLLALSARLQEPLLAIDGCLAEIDESARPDVEVLRSRAMELHQVARELLASLSPG